MLSEPRLKIENDEPNLKSHKIKASASLSTNQILTNHLMKYVSFFYKGFKKTFQPHFVASLSSWCSQQIYLIDQGIVSFRQTVDNLIDF